MFGIIIGFAAVVLGAGGQLPPGELESSTPAVEAVVLSQAGDPYRSLAVENCQLEALGSMPTSARCGTPPVLSHRPDAKPH